MSEANISPEDVVSNAHKGVHSVSYAPSLLNDSDITPSTPPPGGHLSEASYVDMDVIEQVELPEQVKGKLEYHSSVMNPIESEDELTIRGYEKGEQL